MRRFDGSTVRRFDGRALACVTSASFALVCSEARADVTQVCLALDLGEHMQDASRRPAGSGEGPGCCPAGDYGEDYGRRTTPSPGNLPIDHAFAAQRWLARITDANGLPVWGFAPLDENGCTGATWDVPYETATLTVEFVRWADFGTKALIAYDCRFGLPGEDPEAFGGTPVIAGVTPTDAGTTYVDVTAYYESPDASGTPDILAPTDYTLWSTSFAEETVPVWEASSEYDVYVAHAYDLMDVLGSPSRVEYSFGGAPSLHIVGTNYRSKWINAHEYGHILTTIVPGLPKSAVDSTYGGDCGQPNTHHWTSAEWHSNAAFEGFADVYSAWVWSDPVQAQSRIGRPGSNSIDPVPLLGVTCGVTCMCGMGVGNEADWASALYDFQRNTALTPGDVAQLLSIAYGDGSTWVTSGAGFWADFDAAIEAELGAASSEYSEWTTVAATWNIDN